MLPGVGISVRILVRNAGRTTRMTAVHLKGPQMMRSQTILTRSALVIGYARRWRMNLERSLSSLCGINFQDVCT